MSFSYTFQLDYSISNSSRPMVFCPVSAFSVIGGNFGAMHASSTGYMSLRGELDQAVSNKNILLFMPWTGITNDLVVMNDQVSFFAGKNIIALSFLVIRWEDREIQYSIALHDFWATVNRPPQIVTGEQLIMSFAFGSPRLSDGNGNRGGS